MTSHSFRTRAAALLGLATLLGLGALPARAGVVLEIHDRDAGATLPVHRYEGRSWVEGQPRHEYELRLHNRSPHRVLAVVSVDGVNVVSGETAAPSQSGYVLEPWQSMSVEGWRKSLDRVAAFRFTRLANSYAARTGRPNDVGVVGVAVFRELERVQPLGRIEPYEPLPRDEPYAREYDRAASADAAASGPTRSRAAGAAESAPAPAAATAQSHAAQESVAKAESRLGTAHGRRLESRAQWTNFERASSTPDELHTLWYDSRANLIAMGVLPREERYADRARVPQPFPGGFVPDP